MGASPGLEAKDWGPSNELASSASVARGASCITASSPFALARAANRLGVGVGEAAYSARFMAMAGLRLPVRPGRIGGRVGRLAVGRRGVVGPDKVFAEAEGGLMASKAKGVNGCMRGWWR